MKKLLLLGMAALLTTAAFAYPSLQGPTGLVAIPTPDVAAPNAVNLAVDYYNTSKNFGHNAIPIRVVYGVAKSFEVGASYDLLKDVNTIDVNAKWVTPLNYFGSKFTVGAQYMQDKSFLGTTPKDFNLYLVGSHDLPLGIDGTVFTGTLGLNYDKVKSAAIDAGAVRLFLGIDATIKSANNLNIAFDFAPKDSAIGVGKNVFSLAARYPFTPMISGEIGMTNSQLAVFGAPQKNKLFFGVNAAF